MYIYINLVLIVANAFIAAYIPRACKTAIHLNFASVVFNTIAVGIIIFVEQSI